MKTKLLEPTPADLDLIAELLTQDQVVALPTETVYGLAGNAFSTQAIQRIFTAKNRPSFDPLIVHISKKGLSTPEGIIETLIKQNILSSDLLSWKSKSKLEELLQKFWPGPLTVVLPKGSAIPDEVTSGHPTVGLRCPSHPLFQEVLTRISFPLAAPSANRFGRISPTRAEHVLQELEGRIPAVLDGGPCSVGVESTIIQISNPLEVKILRPGQIGVRELEQFLELKVNQNQTLGESNQAQLAPGMLEQHYAPRKPLYLVPHSFFDISATMQFLENNKISGKLAFLSMSTLPPEMLARFPGKVDVLSATVDLAEMAQNLFSHLRALDEDPIFDVLIADIPAQASEGLGAAIVDRLNRASINKPIKAVPNSKTSLK